MFSAYDRHKSAPRIRRSPEIFLLVSRLDLFPQIFRFLVKNSLVDIMGKMTFANPGHLILETLMMNHSFGLPKMTFEILFATARIQIFVCVCVCVGGGGEDLRFQHSYSGARLMITVKSPEFRPLKHSWLFRKIFYPIKKTFHFLFPRLLTSVYVMVRMSIYRLWLYVVLSWTKYVTKEESIYDELLTSTSQSCITYIWII